jgi:hypothetical protein
MWFSDKIVSDVEDVAVIRYVGWEEVANWNEHRRKGEVRLFTGWAWFSRKDGRHQQGLKTISAAYRDAYYVLVSGQATPRLRVVARRVA